MKYEYDNDHLRMLEQLIATGEVYKEHKKVKPCLKIRGTISDEQIRQAIDDTKTWAEIGALVGMTGAGVRARAIALGIQKKKLNKYVTNEQVKQAMDDTKQKKKIKADQIRSVFEQYAETKTWEEMGNMRGMSKQNFTYHAQKLGLERKKLHRSRNKNDD
jgi:ActR/RegA family two-component response regulator